jgi:hypothetical protein
MGLGYSNDKHVIFSFIQRVDFNKSWEDIEYELGYNFGDYHFGKGDNKELRQKIEDTIKFMKIQFDNVFDDENNTKLS